MLYKVRIDSFEGPFDLLIYLILNAKMDIYDIRISEITKQYIDYLDEMEDMDIEVGTEFIVLAAILIKLKAKMLLPTESEDEEISSYEDPRTEIADKLLEYMKVKRLSKILKEREENGLAIFEKPGEDISKYIDNPDEILKTSEDKFVEAFLGFLERKKRLSEVKKRYEEVHRDRVSVEERINYMIKALDERLLTSDTISFSDLIPKNSDKYDIALSFVSMLEMVRTQDIEVSQEELYGNIMVKRKHKSDKFQH